MTRLKYPALPKRLQAGGGPLAPSRSRCAREVRREEPDRDGRPERM